jgi:hypothetical protein
LSGQPEEKHDKFFTIVGLLTGIRTKEQKRVCVCFCVCVYFTYLWLLCFFDIKIEKNLLYFPTDFLSDILHIRIAPSLDPEPLISPIQLVVRADPLFIGDPF